MSNVTTDRRFIVAKMGERSALPYVAIRELDPSHSNFTSYMTKREAWNRANKFAQPLKTKTVKHGLLNIRFTGLDGMTLDLGQAEKNFTPALDIPTQTGIVLPMPATTSSPKMPTEAQINLFNKLCTEIFALNNKDEVYDNGFAPNVTREGASKAISAAIDVTKRLKADKRSNSQGDQPAPAQTQDVPAGHYAVERDGVTKFYRVDCPTEGKWKGYTFVKVQASDEFHPVRNKAQREEILAAIAIDPREASIRYGKEIGRCGVCNRTLTDEASREAGIGPVCAENTGW